MWHFIQFLIILWIYSNDDANDDDDDLFLRNDWLTKFIYFLICQLYLTQKKIR